jgi:hypothetical protein
MPIKEVEGTEASELYDAVEQQAVCVRKLEGKEASAKETLKDIRTDLDEARQELTRLCLVRREKNPLFDSQDGDDTTGEV